MLLRRSCDDSSTPGYEHMVQPSHPCTAWGWAQRCGVFAAHRRTTGKALALPSRHVHSRLSGGSDVDVQAPDYRERFGGCSPPGSWLHGPVTRAPWQRRTIRARRHSLERQERQRVPCNCLCHRVRHHMEDRPNSASHEWQLQSSHGVGEHWACGVHGRRGWEFTHSVDRADAETRSGCGLHGESAALREYGSHSTLVWPSERYLLRLSNRTITDSTSIPKRSEVVLMDESGRSENWRRSSRSRRTRSPGVPRPAAGPTQ